MQPEKPGCFPKHFNLGKIQEEKGVPFYHPNQSLFVWNQDFSFRSSCPQFAELSDITINWSFVCENMVRTNIFDFKVMSKSLGSERPCAVPIWAESLISPEKLFACQRVCRSLPYSWKDLLLVLHWKCNCVSDALQKLCRKKTSGWVVKCITNNIHSVPTTKRKWRGCVSENLKKLLADWGLVCDGGLKKQRNMPAFCERDFINSDPPPHLTKFSLKDSSILLTGTSLLNLLESNGIYSYLNRSLSEVGSDEKKSAVFCPVFPNWSLHYWEDRSQRWRRPDGVDCEL